MKRLFWLGIILSCTTYGYCGPYDWALTMTSDSRIVTLSTTTASPTQILTKDSYVQRTWIINSSTFTIYVSSVSSGLTTSSFAIPGTGSTTGAPVIWTPDGANAPYEGAMWAVANGNTPPTISIFRSK